MDGELKSSIVATRRGGKEPKKDVIAGKFCLNTIAEMDFYARKEILNLKSKAVTSKALNIYSFQDEVLLEAVPQRVKRIEDCV